ncbi:MAG: aconitate hydratase AcnA [Pirellulales bacterium]
MSQAATFDPFQARDTFETGNGKAGIYRLRKLEDQGLGAVSKLPYSIRVLLESVLRNCDGYEVSTDDVKALASWNAPAPAKVEIPFKPSRVVLQDFTGVPAVVDLAAMRSAMKRLGGDPKRINPLIPADLVIDHSVQVDSFGSLKALGENVELEFQRNGERYEFLRWGQKAFNNFRVVPPNVGIVHQVNLEYLAKGVFVRSDKQGPVALPDSLVGTDSHTTMINGLGVVGWGVGGIEAEAVMLGQPLYMLLPEVIGFELTGELPTGATATDMVLTVTQILRKAGVVDKFVEFYGTGVSRMKLADRATIANMAPEYGATMGFFPVDAETLEYMRRTGRSAADVQLAERYYKEQGLFRTDESPACVYTKTMSLDLSTIEPSLAGPKRPQDRVPLASMKKSWETALSAPVAERGFGLDAAATKRTATVKDNGDSTTIGHGAVVIAAITSCTNTSNPSVMIAAGLLAQKAVAKGLKVPPYVKTSLAPGSRVVTDYLDKAGLSEPLNALGFQTVGYGCTTCIGNSGPLPDAVAAAVTEGDLVASAVLSGNRNFEGRVNPHVKANYLASPPLVVAYAIAGTTDIDLLNDPIGQGSSGPVMLKDIWPTHGEIEAVMKSSVLPEMFSSRYAGAMESNEKWNAITVSEGDLFQWNEASTYIQEPPFLAELTVDVKPIQPLAGAKVLAAG